MSAIDMALSPAGKRSLFSSYPTGFVGIIQKVMARSHSFRDRVKLHSVIEHYFGQTGLPN